MDADRDYNILLVEDDEAFAVEFSDYLKSFCVNVHKIDSFSKIRDLDVDRVDLIILDQFVHGHDAIHFLPLLQKFYQGPIVFLTNNAEQTDRVVSLELGADDFIHKTQRPREILARLRAVLRRSRIALDQSKDDKYGPTGRSSYGALDHHKTRLSNWHIDTEKRALFTPDGTDARLTGAEFDALHFMASRKGQVVTREDLFMGILGRSQSGVFDRTIDNLLSRLRRSLSTYHPRSDALFKSVRGKGYIFVGFDDRPSDSDGRGDRHISPVEPPIESPEQQ